MHADPVFIVLAFTTCVPTTTWYLEGSRPCQTPLSLLRHLSSGRKAAFLDKCLGQGQGPGCRLDGKGTGRESSTPEEEDPRAREGEREENEQGGGGANAAHSFSSPSAPAPFPGLGAKVPPRHLSLCDMSRVVGPALDWRWRTWILRYCQTRREMSACRDVTSPLSSQGWDWDCAVGGGRGVVLGGGLVRRGGREERGECTGKYGVEHEIRSAVKLLT